MRLSSEWSSLHKSEPTVQTAGKIPEADIVLLDEIFKCNDGVLNSLLTALNERKYTNEGRTYPIPVISFFAASNEIPNFNDPQEKILEALYDRLELKVVTANMEDRDTRLAVLKNKQAGTFGQVTATITLEELRQMQQEVASILVPDAINELADDILCELRKDMAVSDRKYLGYYPIAQAKAWLSGHDKVESCDLLALKNYLWRLPSDREKVEAVLTRLCVNPMQDKVNNIRGMALESQEVFDASRGDGSKADVSRKALIKLRNELTRLYQMQCELRSAVQSDSEKAMVDALAEHFADMGITKVVGPEARGFMVGVPVAVALGAGFVPARKPGKLPRKTVSESYELEYGTDSIEIHADAISSKDTVLILDDLVATGGTVEATGKLVRDMGAKLVGYGCILELAFLNPREKLTPSHEDVELFSLVTVD